LAELPLTESVGQLQDWNLHLFMRPAAEGSPRFGNPILPSDICYASAWMQGLVPWIGNKVSKATISSFGFGDIHAVWRHFVKDGKPVALNYFAVGDAA